MRPTEDELKKVGSAFVTLGLTTYTADEKNHFTQFLHLCAIDFNEPQVKKIFKKDNAPIIIDAMKTLNHFANEYQEHEIIHEFNDAIVDLLINVNNVHATLII